MTPIETKEQLLAFMKDARACEEAVVWVQGQQGSAADIWDACRRGDWLLWLAGRRGVNHKMLVLATNACARLAPTYEPADEFRPWYVIEATKLDAYTEGIRQHITPAMLGLGATAPAISLVGVTLCW